MRSLYLFNSRILSHIAFWLGVLFIYTFFPYLHQGYFWEVLKHNLFFLPQDIIAVYFVLYVLFPKFLVKFKIGSFIILSLAAILFLTTLSLFVSFYVLPYFDLNNNQDSIMEQFSNSLFALVTITGMAATIKYVRLNLLNQFKHADISMKQMETELKYLRNQLNPHFLFNSLNNIDELIYEDQEKASKAIFHLSEILRYVLKKSEIKTVTAESEIQFINNYIDFVRFSFKDRNFIDCQIEGDYTGLLIPPLMFIPIVENAVKYVDRKAEAPGIKLHFIFNQTGFEFQCTNKIAKKLSDDRKNGIGLNNLKRRLELSFPENHKLDIIKDQGEFLVKLKIWKE